MSELIVAGIVAIEYAMAKYPVTHHSPAESSNISGGLSHGFLALGYVFHFSNQWCIHSVLSTPLNTFELTDHPIEIDVPICAVVFHLT